jgi:ceramide glucosyltransferase
MAVELFLLLTVLSWIYWLAAYAWLRVFFRSISSEPGNYRPPVSILKPVKNIDAQAYDNFKSFCLQDYPQFEILFGVADADDPVIPLIQCLQGDFPELRIRLVVEPVHGANRKAAMLHILAGKARYPVLAISDSDMRVTPDYLRRVVAPLADPQVGLVTCLYKAKMAHTFTARLEALHMGVTFLPSVIVARKVLNMHFAMGATQVTRKRDLARIGGFAAIADYLADDYQLGSRIAASGMRVELSDYVVNCVLGSTTFSEQWHREVRWSHCSRISRPFEYPGLMLSFSTALATVLVLLSGFAWWAWLVLATSILLRWAVGYLVTLKTNDAESRRWLLYLPARDYLSALVWCAGLVGRYVTWRGERFRLHSDGRLIPMKAEDQAMREPLLKAFVRAIDHRLIDYYQIYSFTQDETCLLRISKGHAEIEIQLSDGVFVHPGDPILELHFWNERIPPMPVDGPDLAWALKFQRRSRRSLQLLAQYLENTPDLDDVVAMSGDPPFGSRLGSIDLRDVVRGWGFDVIPVPEGSGLWRGVVEFWTDVYAMGLMWAYNPASIERKRFQGIKHEEVWISRQTLMQKYGSQGIGPKVAKRVTIGYGVEEIQPVNK